MRNPVSAIPLVLAASLLGTAAAADPQPVIEPSIQVRVIGVLRTGIFAIGGETTGTTITAGDNTLELDVS